MVAPACKHAASSYQLTTARTALSSNPIPMLTCKTTNHSGLPLTCRRLHKAYNRVVDGNYAVSGLVGREIRGKTVGVLGTGAIGVEACRIFKVSDRHKGGGVAVRLSILKGRGWKRYQTERRVGSREENALSKKVQ